MIKQNSQHHGLENSQHHGLNGLEDDTDLKSENNQKKSVKSVQSFKIRDSDNIPQLRFPEFRGEWGKKKLGDLLEFKNGINASKEQYGSGYKFINVLDILNNDFITHDKIIGSVNVDEETVNKYPVNFGDILFQRSSETQEEVGTANVYIDKDNTATFGGFVIRGKKIGNYEPLFLNSLLKVREIRVDLKKPK
jgi:type I restriction enzyme S subunit